MPVQIQSVLGPIFIAQFVNECPRCHRAIEIRTSGPSTAHNQTEVEFCFTCPNCLNFFLCTYSVLNRGNGQYNGTLVSTQPQEHVEKSFGRVDAVSPQFVKVYNQAAAAETHALGEIAGVGYRKSLEFLVKDYCISKRPDDEAEIKNKMLGQVIAEYLEDGRIKEAAKRTAWLGNDETHYERRWEGKDLQDLKNLLHLTITSIETALEFDYYMNEMKPPATPANS